MYVFSSVYKTHICKLILEHIFLICNRHKEIVLVFSSHNHNDLNTRTNVLLSQ